MADQISVELIEGGKVVDVPNGTVVTLTLDAGAQPNVWKKDGTEVASFRDQAGDVTPGHDVVYEAADANHAWSATLRWQPDAPGAVSARGGVNQMTVSWTAVAGEEHLDYYEVCLDPDPWPGRAPQRTLRGAGSSGAGRAITLSDVPPNFFDANVVAVTNGGHGPTKSPAGTTQKMEEVTATSTSHDWKAWLLVVVLAAAAAVIVLLVNPTHDAPNAAKFHHKVVDLDNWALLVAAFATIAFTCFVLAFQPLRDLLSGGDRRISTSRTNVAIWTIVIAFGITTLATVAFGAHQYQRKNPCGLTETQLAHAPAHSREQGICVAGKRVASSALAFDMTFKDGLAPNYLVLLGAPFASLAGAAFIVNRQVGNGARQKVPAVGPTDFTDALKNDDGTADLVDSQYLIFTGVLLFYFATNFFPNPSVLPSLPWGLVGLTGVSASTYLLNKSVTTNGLSVVGLDRSAAAIGASVRVLGLNFTPEGSSAFPNHGVSVTLDDQTATILHVTNTEITFEVPLVGVAVHTVKVTTASGATASAGSLKVTAAANH